MSPSAVDDVVVRACPSLSWASHPSAPAHQPHNISASRRPYYCEARRTTSGRGGAARQHGQDNQSSGDTDTHCDLRICSRKDDRNNRQIDRFNRKDRRPSARSMTVISSKRKSRNEREARAGRRGRKRRGLFAGLGMGFVYIKLLMIYAARVLWFRCRWHGKLDRPKTVGA